MTHRQDVIIVGGGPVGIGLAIELGQRGIAVRVIERHASPQPIPKGQNLTQRTMEHFSVWGCEAEVRASRTVPPGYAIGGMTSYGTLLSGYHYDWLQRGKVTPYYYTQNERLPQFATEKALRRRAESLSSIRIDYGWSGIQARSVPGGASVEIMHRAGGELQRIEARYAVACDGAHSAIRESAGIGQTRTDHDRLMVLLVFRSTGLHELLRRYPGKQFYCILHPDYDGYWLFFGRVDLGSTWFFHAPVPPGTTSENFDFAGLLHRAVGQPFDIAFDHIGFWDLRIALADSYRAGNVFLAGDAAHSHPPYGGYGINTGFEDARNLGWKLAAVLQGWAGEALLDSYETERRPVFRSTAEDFIDRFIREDRAFLRRWNPADDEAAFVRAWDHRNEGESEVNAFEPHYEGSPVVFGPAGGRSSASGSHVFTARAGHHLPPADMSDGRRNFERFGPGFTLFDFSPAGHGAVFEAAAARLGMPLAVVQDPEAPARATLGHDLVLVRPDHYVAWTGSGEVPPDADAVLARCVCADAGHGA